MSMKIVKINRQPDCSKGTFGTLDTDSFKCFTCELPWEDNHNDKSCIPIGTYTCKWTHSPRLDKFTYEITAVTNREGIRIHSANYPSELLGCIALGSVIDTVDGKKGVFHSKDTVKAFEELMNKEPFELEIH